MKITYKIGIINGGWQEITIVPKTVDKLISCRSKDLFFIPPDNKIIAIKGFICFDTSLFSLDSCPLITGFIMQ